MSKIKETVYCKERYDTSDWPPEDFIGAIAWFNAKLELIPEEHRVFAKCEFESISSYNDSSYVSIGIYYWRDKNEEERLKEIRQIENNIKYKEDKEKQMLAELKRKYEKQ